MNTTRNQHPLTALNSRHTPGDWRRNGEQIISVHKDTDGEHETLICDVFSQHDWWRANARLIEAAPTLLDVLFDIKRLAEKSGDHESHPFTLLELVACKAREAIARATGGAS